MPNKAIKRIAFMRPWLGKVVAEERVAQKQKRNREKNGAIGSTQRLKNGEYYACSYDQIHGVRCGVSLKQVFTARP